MQKVEAVRYHWQRTSKILFAFFSLYQFLSLAQAVFLGFGVLYWFLLFGGLFFYGLIYSMQIVVDKESLYISYGVGLFSTDVNLSDIGSFTIQKNNSLIAWVYNPFGENALRLHFRSRRDIVLPTNEAKKLMNILKHSV